jgi:hypothetical protein
MKSWEHVGGIHNSLTRKHHSFPSEIQQDNLILFSVTQVLDVKLSQLSHLHSFLSAPSRINMSWEDSGRKSKWTQLTGAARYCPGHEVQQVKFVGRVSGLWGSPDKLCRWESSFGHAKRSQLQRCLPERVHGENYWHIGGSHSQGARSPGRSADIYATASPIAVLGTETHPYLDMCYGGLGRPWMQVLQQYGKITETVFLPSLKSRLLAAAENPWHHYWGHFHDMTMGMKRRKVSRPPLQLVHTHKQTHMHGHAHTA